MLIKERPFGIIRIKSLALFWMWWYMLITPVIVYWGGLPRTLLYVGDLIGCSVFGLICRSILIEKRKTYIMPSTKCAMALFLVCGTVSAIVNKVSLLHYVWGLRNCGRFFVFFVAVALYLNIEDFLRTRKIIDAIFWISFPLCWYETYMISYPAGTIIGDMVGGIYHGFSGVTMPLNMILVIESVAILDDYFQNQVKLPKLLITLMAAVVMSGWGELKVFIVELGIIVAVQMILAKKGIKSILIIIMAVVAFSYIVTFFTEVNARGRTSYGDIFSLEGFLEYISHSDGYDGVGDLNRIGGISTLNEGVFKSNWLQHIIGQGIGSAEYTNFFVSPFYQMYENLHYAWFQMIWVYIENGYIGVVAMFLFFVAQLVDAFHTIKDIWLRNFTVTVLVLVPVLFVYNTTLRSEVSGFYFYFILALPCLFRKARIIQSQKGE